MRSGGKRGGVIENKRTKHTGKREKSIWSGHQFPATIKFEEEGESLGYSDGVSLLLRSFRAKRNKKGEEGLQRGYCPSTYKRTERSLILAGDYDLNERNAS